MIVVKAYTDKVEPHDSSDFYFCCLMVRPKGNMHLQVTSSKVNISFSFIKKYVISHNDTKTKKKSTSGLIRNISVIWANRLIFIIG